MRGAMITAVDSSILLDVLTDDPSYRASSARSLRAARAAGRVIACPVVWGEIRGYFEDVERMHHLLAAAEIHFDPFDRECSDVAGSHWREYRRRGGSRSRLLADFLVAAHAHVRGGRLLTRDRGFYRRYFTKLEIV